MRLEEGRGQLRLEGVVNKSQAGARLRWLQNFGSWGPLDFYGEAHGQAFRSWADGDWSWELGAGGGMSW